MKRQYDYYKKIADGINKLTNGKRYRNCIPIISAETDLHLKQKITVCKILRLYEYDFFANARFQKGGVADIYIPYLNVAIEIMERDEIFNAGRIEYNVDKIIPINASDNIGAVRKILKHYKIIK